MFIILAWGAAKVFRRWHWPQLPLALLACSLLLACSFQTRHQLRYWQNTETLFGHALAIRDYNHPMIASFLSYHYYDLANDAREAGRLDEAIAIYQKALKLNASYAPLHNNLGLAFQAQGRLPEAINEHLLAISLSPASISARNNLAVAFTRIGKLDEAIEQLTEVLRLDPTSAKSYNNLGSVLGRKGNYREAIRQFKEALRLMPDNPVLYDNLGDALVLDGNRDEAIASYHKAIQLNPNDPRANQQLHVLGVKTP